MTPSKATMDAVRVYWLQAVAEEFGIIITLPSPDEKHRLEDALYESRRALADPAMAEFMLAHPGDRPEELWIVRKTTDLTGLTL